MSLSSLGLGGRAVDNCGRCLLRGGMPVYGRTAATLLRQPTRHVTSVAKRALATKGLPTLASATSARRKNMNTLMAAAPASNAIIAGLKKNTRAATTKTTTTMRKKRADAIAPVTASRAASSDQKLITASRFKAPPTEQHPDKPAAPPRAETPLEPETQKVVDMSNPEFQKKYKKAARKYINLMVALPILLVTSYYLFDRLALGNEPEDLRTFPSSPAAGSKTSES
ncbi:hypothetical protein B0T17DRAFT_276029 [Bombardia bombarda]|uniref:Uncharacterized protein n=1 Tax=Bombardia bombarda TaxID=252184 RepID=A0AA40C5L3_9PEZI|nr:hypothetical protein B0T17DRAFT_276029 [Bombardia bombarda]